MPYGYWGKFSRRQCKIQLSKYNLEVQKVLESAFFGFQKGLKYKTFTLVTTIDLPPEYTGFITNLPFWATQRLERRTIPLINLETAYIFWVVENGISGNPKNPFLSPLSTGFWAKHLQYVAPKGDIWPRETESVAFSKCKSISIFIFVYLHFQLIFGYFYALAVAYVVRITWKIRGMCSRWSRNMCIRIVTNQEFLHQWHSSKEHFLRNLF